MTYLTANIAEPAESIAKENYMKTITMMQLRSSPGEYAFRVRADGESFIVTYQGKPCFKMVPVDDVTRVRPDGTFTGPKPLTMGLKL
jgi:antitoxin (DNA-binding transcriptional repressor) of toxin-antitoxin stability system